MNLSLQVANRVNMGRMVLLLTPFLLFPCGLMADTYCAQWEWIFLEPNPFLEFDGAVLYDMQELRKTEVLGQNRDRLIRFGNEIQALIVAGDASGLADLISERDFRLYGRYGDVFEPSENISMSAVKQLKLRKGPIYSVLFGRASSQPASEWPSLGSSESADLRAYLRCFRQRQRWRILYWRQKDVYDLWFSMPGGFMISFAFHHFVVRIEDGVPRLAGF